MYTVTKTFMIHPVDENLFKNTYKNYLKIN